MSIQTHLVSIKKKSSLSQFLERTVEIFVADESFSISRTQNPPKFIFRERSRRGTLVTCHIALDIFSLFAKPFFVRNAHFQL